MHATKPELSLVVAMTPDRVIGAGNRIPWRISSDMARFKQLTTKTGVVVMGRKTWESIPAKFRPLPGRHNIILSKSGFAPTPSNGSVQVVSTVDAALAAIAAQGERACVIGGGQIYELFLPLAQKICVTMVNAKIDGDAYFPRVHLPDWRVQTVIRGIKDPGDEFRSSYFEYHRARG